MRGFLIISFLALVTTDSTLTNNSSPSQIPWREREVTNSDTKFNLSTDNQQGKVLQGQGNFNFSDNRSEVPQPPLLWPLLKPGSLLQMAKSVIGSQDIRLWLLPKPEAVHQRCYDDVIDFLDGLIGQRKDPVSLNFSSTAWALRMLDAFGKPEPGILSGALQWVGHYQQCLDTRAQIPKGVYLGSRTTPRRTRHEFDGQYCRVRISLPETWIPEDAIPKTPRYWTDVAKRTLILHWGICLPHTCTSDDVMHLATTGTLGLLPPAMQITNVFCSSRDSKLSHDKAAMMTLCVLTLVAIILAICTVVDLALLYGCFHRGQRADTLAKEVLSTPYQEIRRTSQLDTIEEVSALHSGQTQRFKQVLPKNDTHKGNIGPNTPLRIDLRRKDVLLPDNAAMRPLDHQEESGEKVENKSIRVQEVLRAFSLHRSGTKLLATAPNPDPDPARPQFPCLDGIRVLSMAWILLGHTYYGPVVDLHNITYRFLDAIPHIVSRFSFNFVVSAHLSVDTFFVLSGLLVMTLTLRKLRDGNYRGPGFWITFYIHRVWRLTPVYMAVLLAGTTLTDYLISGPLKPESDVVFRHCPRLWWTNLLYINNFVDPLDICMSWTWFLAVDMQLYFISPVFILVVHWSRRHGVALLLVTIGLGIAATFLTSLQNPGQLVTSTFEKKAYVKHVYYVPWLRLPVFAIGMLLAVVMEDKAGDWTLSKPKALGLWLFLSTVAGVLIFLPYAQWREGQELWPKGGQVVYEAVCHSAWAIFVAWVVFACHTGVAGFVGRFLEWAAFKPLAKLTYCVYLVHPIVIAFFLYTRTTALDASDAQMVYQLCGNLIMSYAVALVFSLMFESPALALEKVFLARK